MLTGVYLATKKDKTVYYRSNITHKGRHISLGSFPSEVQALQLYLRKRNTMEGLSPKEKAVFITRMRKERISNRRVEQLISGAMKAAGLKGFSTHKLRHTAATLMYQTGK